MRTVRLNRQSMGKHSRSCPRRECLWAQSDDMIQRHGFYRKSKVAWQTNQHSTHPCATYEIEGNKSRIRDRVTRCWTCQEMERSTCMQHDSELRGRWLFETVDWFCELYELFSDTHRSSFFMIDLPTLSSVPDHSNRPSVRFPDRATLTGLEVLFQA